MLYNEKRRLYAYSLDCFKNEDGSFSRIKIGETCKELEGEKGVRQRIKEQKGTGVPGEIILLDWWPSVNIEDTDLHRELEKVYQKTGKHNEWFNLSLIQVKIVYDKLHEKIFFQNQQREMEQNFKEIVKRLDVFENMLNKILNINNINQLTNSVQKEVDNENLFIKNETISQKIKIKDITEFMQQNYIDIYAYVNWAENMFNTLINHQKNDLLEKILLEFPKHFTFNGNFQRKDGRLFLKKFISNHTLSDKRTLTINRNLSTGAKQEIISQIEKIIAEEM